MNNIEIAVYQNVIGIVMRQDDSSDPDSVGTVVVNEAISTDTHINDQWYTIELIRDNLDVSIFFDGIFIYEMTIPERFLELDMNVKVGGGSRLGYDAKISSLEYGNFE